MTMPILSIKKVTKTYNSNGTPVHALKGVNLDIHQGEILGLLGVNGAGKTTLSSILATLHPVTSGDIFYNGVSIYDDLIGYRHALGFCPQKQNLDQVLTVEENLIFAGRYFAMKETIIRERVEVLLEQLELTRYRNFDVDDLSGGNRQRVLIARALIHEPDIVILDEPTVGLDPDIRKRLWEIIKGLKKNGITVILTTHYLDEAEELSDRICILHHGNIQLIESVQDLKNRHQKARLEDIFLKLMDDYRKQEA